MNINLQFHIGRREIIGVALLAFTAILGYKVGAARADGPPDADALTYSGVLEQANGTVYTGSHSIQLQIWKDAAGTQAGCAAPASTPMDLGTTGHFQLTLSSDCQAAFKSQKDLWTEVFVDGNSTGKSKVGAVPYALEAGHATNASTANAAAGSLATQIQTLDSTALKTLDTNLILPGAPGYDECRDNSSPSLGWGACNRMAFSYCLAQGYKGGWWTGNSASPGLQVQCIK